MQQLINQRDKNHLLTNWRGVLLMALGALFLWLNLSPGAAENWWAVFILLPGLLFVGGSVAVSVWANGRFKSLSRTLFGLGVIVLTVAAIFFLNLAWEQWWPLMLMVPGAALWFASPEPDQPDQALVGTAVAGMSRWFGLTTLLLGGTFLLDQLHMMSLAERFGNHPWWGWFILIPAVGAFLLAGRIRLLDRHSVVAPILVGVGLVIGGTAVRELLQLTWHQLELVGSIAFIVGGVALLITGRRQRQR